MSRIKRGRGSGWGGGHFSLAEDNDGRGVNQGKGEKGRIVPPGPNSPPLKDEKLWASAGAWYAHYIISRGHEALTENRTFQGTMSIFHVFHL